MKLFAKVGIIGTGLIGGSLAAALKKARLCNFIIGVARHKETLDYAIHHGLIDAGSQDISIVSDADLLILAAPPEAIKRLSVPLSKIVKAGCVVTDVASLKGEIVNLLEKIFPHYMGSHPLAGLEKRGIKNSSPNIFRGALCILTPTPRTSPFARKKIEILWRRLGAKTAAMNPGEHDKVVSLVSHLPHAVAFSLAGAIPARFLNFAAGGLKDTTRIAASDPELWGEIMLGNRKELLRGIACFTRSLRGMTSAIKRRDKKKLISILRRAKKNRQRLNSL
jgi:prephenate dehydrogenase